MVTLGYALSSEEHPPSDLVENARRAEDAGFEFALVSDHYHPWIAAQGNSPFVWNVLGAISEATEDLEVGTGVTCPLVRLHPAVVAQAAATAAAMLPGRFFLGVGTGENLNEHVVGERWPHHDVRLEMLEEAVEIIRRLWEGETYSHHGDHYEVETARLYTLPDEPPPIHVAAGGPEAAAAAGGMGDGLVSTSPDESIVETFAAAREEAGTADAAGEAGRAADPGDAPRYGQLTVCWADDEASGVRTVLEHWPNGALPGELGQDLPTPAHFEQVTSLVDADDVREAVVCGSDVDEHVEAVRAFADAGFDHVYVHQVGPDQERFLDAYSGEVLPAFA